jgi:hypothetical protein
MIVRVGALITAVCLLGGCSWDGGDGRDRNPANQPGYALPTSPGVTPPADTDHAVRGGGTATIFQLVSGSDVVRVRVVDLGQDLYRISTPENAKVAPTVSVDGGTVVAGLRNTGFAGPAVVTALLSSKIRWDVRLSGGAQDELVDLTGGPGGNVDFSAGTSRAEAILPAAAGTQRVVMSGGASQFVVRLGGAAPVRVAAKGGAGSVTLDGTTRTGVAGGSIWTPDNWASTSDRYDVDATAGVSSLTVERM